MRLEDWQRFEKADQAGTLDPSAKLERNASELMQALHAATRSAAPILVCLCPTSPLVMAKEEQAALFQEMEVRLASGLESTGSVYLIKSAELAGLYPVKEYYDAYSDKMGKCWLECREFGYQREVGEADPYERGAQTS